jgi:hypothetical protein
LPDLGSVQKTMKGGTSNPELSLRSIHDLLLGKVASVRNDNTETLNLSRFRFDIRDSSKSVPLSKRLLADLETVEGLHASVLEVKTGSVVAQLLGVDNATTEAGPGCDCAGSGDADAPEVGGSDKRVGDGLVPFVGCDAGLDDVVDPECKE